MRRDTIFYKLFKQFPGLLFELVDEPPPEADNYQFESVEVKETAFRIDGVFLPPANAVSKTVFFAEVQFQKDEDLYHRFFSELFLFLYRHSIRYEDWFGVIIFGSGSLEPSNPTIHRALLESDQVKRIYLDELGDLRQQSLGLGLMLLTNVTSETKAVEGARFLLEQARQQSEQVIIDLVTMLYIFKN
jgi:predicted transposase/invertase (TIGR01784 family)